jgi:two-component system LytT family sensor kinase
MSHPSKAQSRWITALVIFLIFLLKLLILLPQVWFYNKRSAAPLPSSLLLAKLVIGTYSWAVLVPLILPVSRRWQVERQNFLRCLMTHFCFGLAFAAAQTIIYHWGLALVMPHQQAAFKELPRLDGPWSFVFNGILAYASIVAVHQAILHFQKYQEREFSLQQAQLQILKMQLHPHFLFNTLNTLVQLIHENQQAAEKMVINLSDMLRVSLYSMSEQEVTLKQELEFVDRYLEIMKTRFEDRLEVRMNIDPQTLRAYVPTMILQPLVENSIHHGISPREKGGHIEIKTIRAGGMLHILIIDNGKGIEASDKSCVSRNSIGLGNTRARLHYLYGSQHYFDLYNLPGCGVTVCLSIPFHEHLTEALCAMCPDSGIQP